MKRTMKEKKDEIKRNACLWKRKVKREIEKKKSE